jgi:pimeloyl-ACP methyl ester carboxylesterase
VASVNTVEANGIEFAYLEEGEGPLVLLLHGFPDTPHTWDAVRPALAAAGHRAVAPFNRGYRPTSIPADGRYDSRALGEDVLALIDALGNGDPAIVVGHDWGAMAAYTAAALNPDRVRFLVTLAIPHPGSLKPSLPGVWKVRHFITLRLPGAAKRFAANDFADVDTLVERWSPAWVVPREETRPVKECFSDPDSLDAALGYYRAMPLGQPDELNRRPITVPAVSFAGMTDGGIAPDPFFDAARLFTAGYEVVRMPGGHFMHRENPELFNRELLRVLPTPAV